MNVLRVPFALGTGLVIALAAAQAPTMAAEQDHFALATLYELKGKSPFVRYGDRAELGNGEARTYLEFDIHGNPIEVGVALSEAALEGLPASGTGHHGGHEMPHTYLLDLPEQAGVPFRFLELNWNPSGHEPEGVYAGVPHFDFHFYTVGREVRESIVPTDPRWAEKANHVPAPEFIPEHNAALAPPGVTPDQAAVPMMGLHWVDMTSHELQGLLGKPEAYSPFTATFIHGSWDGQMIFWEPMITRAHILAKKAATTAEERDEFIAIPTPQKYQQRGWYPAAYRIMWDESAREYRIALTRLSEQG